MWGRAWVFLFGEGPPALSEADEKRRAEKLRDEDAAPKSRRFTKPQCFGEDPITAEDMSRDYIRTMNTFLIDANKRFKTAELRRQESSQNVTDLILKGEDNLARAEASILAAYEHRVATLTTFIALVTAARERLAENIELKESVNAFSEATTLMEHLGSLVSVDEIRMYKARYNIASSEGDAKIDEVGRETPEFETYVNKLYLDHVHKAAAKKQVKAT